MKWLQDFFVEDGRLGGRRAVARARGRNAAYVDGQNLNLSTGSDEWDVDWGELVRHLRERYGVGTVYYFPGYRKKVQEKMYEKMEQAGFTLVFKEYDETQTSVKKGDVDAFMMFTILTDLFERGDSFEKIVLISGDGDFYVLVKFLLERGRFEKMLLPTRKSASSLYVSLRSVYRDYLDRSDVRELIELKDERA